MYLEIEIVPFVKGISVLSSDGSNWSFICNKLSHTKRVSLLLLQDSSQEAIKVFVRTITGFGEIAVRCSPYLHPRVKEHI